METKPNSLVVDSGTVDCFIYTYKDGFLARLAHDLKLRVEQFQIVIRKEVESTPPNRIKMHVRAVFDATSIRSVTAMKNGAESPDTLKLWDHALIEQFMRLYVLKSGTFPEIVFSSTGFSRVANQLHVEGALTLRGVTRRLVITKKKGTRKVFSGGTSLYQPDFGITPFSTFMGAIKIKPEVRIELHIMQTQLEKVVSSNPDFFPKGLSAVRKMIKDLCLKDPEHRPVDQSKTKRSTKQFIPLKISFSNAARCTSKNDLRTPAA